MLKRTLVVVAVIASLPVVVPVMPVLASCGPSGNLREEIDDAESVIVGTVTEAGVPDTDRPETELGRPLRWTIDVERDIKDNVGPAISFTAGTTGSRTSSQFEAHIGERVGLLLRERRDGELWASLCDKRSPADVLAAAAPLPPPRGRGLPLLLAAGSFGSPRVALFDERGVVTRFGAGRGDARLGVCPDERSVAEVVSESADLFTEDASPTSVEIRDMRSMRVVRRMQLPATITSAVWHRPFAVACRDARASDVLIAAEAGGYSAHVVRLRNGRWRTVYRGKARAVRFLPDGFVVVKHGGKKFELVVHAPDGKVRDRLGPLPSFKHLAISEPVQLVVDGTGRFVAGANEGPGVWGEQLFVADLRRGEVARAHVGWVGGLAWAERDLVVAPLLSRDRDGNVDPADGGEARIYDTSLERQASWRRWTGSLPVVIGERLFGVRASREPGRPSGGSVIVSAPYRTGPEQVENDIGGLSIHQLVALSGESAAADRQRPQLTWAAPGLLVFVIVLAAIVLRARLHREPSEAQRR